MPLFGRRRNQHAHLPAPPPKPVQASVQSFVSYKKVRIPADETWQAQVRQFDREGPGFVGFALDLKSLVASMAVLIPQKKSDAGEWVPDDDPVSLAVLEQYHDREDSQAELVRKQMRQLESVGEYWLYPREGDNGLYWSVAAAPQLDWRGDMVLIRERPENWSESIVIPETRLIRCWNPDDEWPGLAYSQFRRALPDIRRYRSIVRNVHRTVDSRILTNGLIWFPPVDDEFLGMEFPENDTPVQGVDKRVGDYMNAARRALDNDDSFEAFAPFPDTGPQKPEFVEVGRQLDPNVIAAEQNALQAVARALDMPMQILTEGPGAGNHWSDYLLKDEFLQTSIAPKLGQVCGQITTVGYRPMLKALQGKGVFKGDPARRRVWYDMTDVTMRPNSSDLALRAWQLGLSGFRAAGQAVGLTEHEQLALPDDMNEYDHWQHAIGQGDPRVPVQRENPSAPDPARGLSYTAAPEGLFPPYGRDW